MIARSGFPPSRLSVANAFVIATSIGSADPFARKPKICYPVFKTPSVKPLRISLTGFFCYASVQTIASPVLGVFSFSRSRYRISSTSALLSSSGVPSQLERILLGQLCLANRVGSLERLTPQNESDPLGVVLGIQAAKPDKQSELAVFTAPA